MKTALLLLALGATVTLVHGWGSEESGFTEFSYQEYSRLEYSFKFGGSRSSMTGKCSGGVFDCDDSCKGDPVCKCADNFCGSTICKASETCYRGTCYEYVCEEGYEVISIEEEACEEVCDTEYEEECEIVPVCTGVGRRLRSFGFEVEKSSSVIIEDKGHGKGCGGVDCSYAPKKHHHDDLIIEEPWVEEPWVEEPWVEKPVKTCHDEEHCSKVPKKVCKDVCKPISETIVTKKKCGYVEELVKCGSGYCLAGDECLVPSCEKKCSFKSEEWCW